MLTRDSKMRNDLLKNILIIDTEASGLDPLKHSLLSVGLCTLHQDTSLEIYIKEPSIIADPRAMAIHGIRLETIDELGLKPYEACLRIEQFLSTHFNEDNPILLAGHNIAFDVNYLKRLYRLADRALPSQLSHRVVDTHSLLWGLALSGQIPEKACSSDGAFEYFNCAPPEALRHSALGDALATKQLLLEIVHLYRKRL